MPLAQPPEKCTARPRRADLERSWAPPSELTVGSDVPTLAACRRSTPTTAAAAARHASMICGAVRLMCTASWSCARAEREAWSHRQVAGGLGREQGGGRRALAGTQNSARACVKVDVGVAKGEARRTMKKHVFCECPRSESGIPPCLTRWQRTRVNVGHTR